jgi:hypothetical protein
MTETRWWIRARWPEVGRHGVDRVFVAEVGDFIVPLQFEATVIRTDRSADTPAHASARNWPPLTMVIAMQGARPVIRQLAIGEPPEQPFVLTSEDRERLSDEELEDLFRLGPDEGPGRAQPAITASLLRELPLARLAKYAMLGVAFRRGEEPVAEPVLPRDFRDNTGFYRIGPGEVDDEDQYGVYFGGIEPAWEELWSEQMEALAARADNAATASRRNRITDDLLDEVAHVYRQAITDRRPPKKAIQQAWHVSEATAGRYIMRARERGYLGKTVRGKKGEISQ